MKNSARLAWFAALGGSLGIWLYLTLFPSPQRVIRGKLEHLARSASFGSKEGVLTRLAHAQSLGDYFCTNVDVCLDIPRHETRQFVGREDIVEAAMATRTQAGALKVQFPNISIKVSPDKQTAVVELTLEASVQGEPDPIVEELNLTLRKIGGEWLITRVKSIHGVS